VNESAEERLAALLDQASAMAEAMRSSYKPPPEITEAADTAGVVTVTLEGQSKKVTRVVVAADWKDKTDPEGLELAIVEAVLSAQLGPVRDFLSAVTEAPPSTPPTLPRPPVVKEPSSTLDWDGLERMFDTVDRALDALAMSDHVAAASEGQRTGVDGVSDNRRVTVTLVAGQLTAVKIDPKWAVSTNRQSLCDSLGQAFSAVYSAAAASPAQGQAPDTGISSALRAIVEQMGVTPPNQLREEPEE
jgi:DNA-binding protein YbaB